MYPYELFWGIDLYSIFLLAGVLAAFLVFRICADRRKMTARLQNFILFDGFLSVVAGYLGAVLAQAVFDYWKTGVFRLDKDTGATFLGGLIAGTAVFFVVYFGAGAVFFKKHENAHLRQFPDLLSIGGGCIAVAHALGRIGCFFAGCCYGKPTDSVFGIHLVGMDHKTIPVQLMESAFLFLLFGVIMFFNMKKERFLFGMPVYMVSYGIWRYFAEFLRDDDRGEFFIKIFTPSQFTSILLVAGGVTLFLILYNKYYGRKKVEA